MHRPPLLVIAAQEKEDLRLKGITFAVSVKIGEKGILFKYFQQDFGVECWLKKAGEGRLADSDDPFDGNIHGKAPIVKSRLAGWRFWRSLRQGYHNWSVRCHVEGIRSQGFGFTSMPILPDAGVFGSDDIVALDTATLDVIGKTRLIEENLPTTMEVHTREGHPFQWLHGPHKDPYKVTEYGERLGIGSREYELVDVLPLEFPEHASMPYIAAH